MSEITSEIVAEHSLSSREYDKVLEILGRQPKFDRTRDFLGHVVRALFLQVFKILVKNATDGSAMGDLRTGRERWYHRYW